MLRNDASDKHGAHFRTVALMLWRDSLLSPHSLRHSFIALALRGGAGLRMVQAAARHAGRERLDAPVLPQDN